MEIISKKFSSNQNSSCQKIPKLTKNYCSVTPDFGQNIEEMYGINCVDSEKALIENIGLLDTHYTGKTKQFYYDWNGKVYFDRFMAIGTK